MNYDELKKDAEIRVIKEYFETKQYQLDKDSPEPQNEEFIKAVESVNQKEK